MNTAIGSFDVYNIYDTCGSDHYLLDYFTQETPGGPYVLKAFAPKFQNEMPFSPRSQDGLGEGLHDYECGGEAAMNVWLADPAVPAAIHVRAGTAGQRYTKTAGDLRPLYSRLIQKYRVLIYSGDVDACVPYWGSEEWTRNLGFKVVKDWHPWNSQYTNGHYGNGGYVIDYENDFTFLTIKGAGHMVPTYKPTVALTMISRWIAGTPF